METGHIKAAVIGWHRLKNAVVIIKLPVYYSYP
jgi:hypothetical protein